MDTPPPCPVCGTPKPKDGLCPRCLLGAGLDEGGAHAAAAPPSPQEIGKAFPAFEVLELLGQGGMGIVYKARQKSLDRMVALKVLPPEIAREQGFAERFTREAKTLARLHHEHIVGIHEFGEANGLYYLVMEFVDGPNLRQVIREGKLAAAEALAIVPQVCAALQYAHDQGVVHRDIKPENILLDRAGRVKIADFGLAKIVQRAPLDLTLTRAGQVMGTLQYMAPEQYREPDSVDHRADIFSLGVVFYEMLTGELPVGMFPPPSARGGVDARLDGVVSRALERERDRRWQKASEMGTRIDTIASGAPAEPVARGAVPAGRSGGAPEAPQAPVSRLAVYGALGVPASFAASLVVFLLILAFTGSPTAGVPWLALPAVVVFLAGWVMSVVAWVQIGRSNGRLRGLPWAVLGTLLPLLVLFVVAPVLLLVGRYEKSKSELGPRARSVAERSVLGDQLIAAGAARVGGGPKGMSDAAKASLVAHIEALWPTIVRLSRDEPNSAAKAMALAPSDRRKFEAMSRAERKTAANGDFLGILFPPTEGFRTPPNLAWVVLDRDGTRARVVRTGSVGSGEGTVSFPVHFEGGAWYPALGPVESKDEPLEESDRSGWILSRWFGEARDPDERVTGGPASLTPADRNLVALRLQGLWSSPARRNALGSLWPVTESADRARLYHVALDRDGTSGRVVLSDGTQTFALAVALDDARDWKLLAKDAESRPGGAVPDDRSGHLNR